MKTVRITDDEFATFWQRYPRKVGKLAAEKAYRQARTRASAQQLLDGVERYVRTKPAYADWAHPRTWLSQGRWLDEADAPPVQVLSDAGCDCEPSCGSKAAHAIKRQLEALAAEGRPRT